MEKISLEMGDAIIIDPCYIKKVSCDFDPSEMRFDALKHEKTLHEGGDGEFEIKLASGSRYVGCDSGRIWLMTSEFGCDVEVDSGFSGYILLRKGDADLYNDIEGDYACEK